jgi:hypothetical protein
VAAPGAADAFWHFLKSFRGPFWHPELATREFPRVPGCFWHAGCGPDAGCPRASDYELDNLYMPRYHWPRTDVAADTWLRIPINAPQWPPNAPDRDSCYGGRWTKTYVRAFHRTDVKAMVAGGDVYDWKTGATIRYDGIAKDGFMRNGINDSNNRGVWSYLHFLHPWHPASNEIVVELLLSRSTSHKGKNKLHKKFCASPDSDAPGARNLHTSMQAIHVHRTMVPAYPLV